MEVGSVSGVPRGGTAASSTAEATPADMRFSGMLAIPRSADPAAEIEALRPLRSQYPGILFAVGDASEFAFLRHPAFPYFELFKKKIDQERLKRWRPRGDHKQDSEGGQTIPTNAYAVMIHPDAYRRMRQDIAFARKVAQRIHQHFKLQLSLAERRREGSSIGMSQFVSVTREGDIGDYVVVLMPHPDEQGIGGKGARRIRVVRRGEKDEDAERGATTSVPRGHPAAFIGKPLQTRQATYKAGLPNFLAQPAFKKGDTKPPKE